MQARHDFDLVLEHYLAVCIIIGAFFEMYIQVSVHAHTVSLRNYVTYQRVCVCVPAVVLILPSSLTIKQSVLCNCEV